MNFIITLLLLFLILSIIIFVHEFGHFLMAKKCGIYVEEFALGMGPVLFKYKSKKGDTTYSLRAIPMGGFVSMAEKEVEGVKLKKNQVLDNKNVFQKLAVLLMGIIMNFILAIFLFFISGLIYGKPVNEPVIGNILEGSAADGAGLEVGDTILEINGSTIYSWDDIILEISAKELKDIYEFNVLKSDGTTKKYILVPEVKSIDGTETRVFGIGTSETKYEKGLVPALSYGIEGFVANVNTIFKILGSLFTGEVSVDNLSGPVGIYSIVDTFKAQGFQAIIYLIAYLSVNVGVINLIPIPVFDGGRVLLVLIETITKKKTSEKLETIINYVGFGLMILLMLYVTFNDIIRLIG